MDDESTSPIGCDAAVGMEIERVRLHLESRMKRRIRNLRLLLRGKGLVLQGQASNYHAKQLAQHEVMAATELPIVANEIGVP